MIFEHNGYVEARGDGKREEKDGDDDRYFFIVACYCPFF